MTPSFYRRSQQGSTRLADLVEQLRRLPRNPIMIPARIQLCRQALEQVRREDQPKLWAQLHSEMGLCLTQASTGDPAGNQEQAIKHYGRALEEYTPSAHFGEWVAMMHNLAVIYTRRIRGDRAENLEIAIGLHEEILQTCTLRTSPKVWSLTHYDLGRLYAQRVKGDRTENLETAIDHCQRVLKVWTRDSHPVGWAKAQDLLGTLYRRRLLGDPAENLEESLRYHQAALEELELRKRAREQDWARAHHNMGTALFHRIRGNRADNLEQAITHLEKALEVRIKRTSPTEWAETQHNLAVAYIERQRENRAENVERAIELLEAVSGVRQRGKFPVEWAMTQNALGIAYLKRIRGERTENLERAIDYFKGALQEQERVGPAEEKASTQHNLAIAYSERLLEDRIENLKKAAKFGKAALETLDQRALIKWATIKTDMVDILWKLANLEQRQRRTEQAAAYMEEAIAHGEEAVSAFKGQSPSHRWALAHYNLGNVYSDRIHGERADNQEKAIEYYNRALNFYTDQNFPDRWANTHNNLGTVYWERVRGKREENLEEAICHFDTALKVFEPVTFPIDARRAARNLGNLYFDLKATERQALGLSERKRWEQARAAYATAIRAAEILYRASYSPGGKKAELAENIALYTRMVQTCLEEPDYAAALVAAEGGKARTFLDQMGQGAFPPPSVLPADLLQREQESIEKLRGQEQDLARLLAGQGTEAGGGWESPYERDIIEQRRETLAALEAVWDEMARDYPAARSYVAMRRGEPMTWDDLCGLAERLGPEAALVEFYTLPEEVVVFVLRAGWEAPRVHRAPVGQQKLLNRYLLPYRGEVINHESGHTLTHDWLSLGESLLAPLEHLLSDAALVYFVPHGILHYLPLHALTVTGGPFIVRWAVAYAPSAAVLARTLESPPASCPELAEGGGSSALVMGYTHREEERALFEGEAQSIAVHLRTSPLLGGEANAETLSQRGPGARVIHLSCHGHFHADDPATSCVRLASGEFTTRDWMSLSLCADLVALSACETGISKIEPGDDPTGLTRALLYAGASSALVTLWSVSADTTLEWMLDFYGRTWDEQGNKKTTEALAFQQATLDLRKRYPDPYYWAPFALVGDWR